MPTASPSLGNPPVRLDSEITSWNHSAGKRILDVLLASVLLVAALPLMLVIAVCVRLTSAGPALFRQRRVGKDGRQFEILKFRTMFTRKTENDVKITRAGDARITPLGRVLRKCKLDELPQLINVILGQMSFVGPRPDMPQFCAELRGNHRNVLRLKPGITGWATIHFRNEEELLRNIEPERIAHVYINDILQTKADLDLQYASSANLMTDLKLLLRTASAIFA